MLLKIYPNGKFELDKTMLVEDEYRKAFFNKELVKITHLLHELNKDKYTKFILRHLANDNVFEGSELLAAELATSISRYDFAIQISKKAKIKGKSHKNSVEKMMQKFYENASNILDLNEFVFESFKEKQSFSIRRSSKDFYYFGNKIGIKTEELLGKESLFFDIFLEIGRIKKISKIYYYK